MTNYTKLIQRLRTDAIFDSTTLGNEAADKIEEQAAEIERLKAACDKYSEHEILAGDDQEPVAWIEWDLNMDEGDPDSITAGCNKPYLACDGWEWRPLYAAPKAQEPLTDEQIYKVFAATVEEAEPFSEVIGDPIWNDVVEITRAVEAAHGIGGKP